MLFGVLYSLFFALFGNTIIKLLTNVPEVIQEATHYLPWIVVLPILAMSCFLFDGVFVGLTRAKNMRNSMILSAGVGFFGVFWVFIDWENNGLWLAMSCFMLMRGVTLIIKYYHLKINNQLLD